MKTIYLIVQGQSEGDKNPVFKNQYGLKDLGLTATGINQNEKIKVNPNLKSVNTVWVANTAAAKQTSRQIFNPEVLPAVKDFLVEGFSVLETMTPQERNKFYGYKGAEYTERRTDFEYVAPDGFSHQKNAQILDKLPKDQLEEGNAIICSYYMSQLVQQVLDKEFNVVLISHEEKTASAE